MNVLIVGANGQLGRALQETAPSNANVTPRDIPDLDIVDTSAVLRVCRESSPDVVINAAAYTAVDKAESESDLAHAINVEGVRNLAAASADVGASLIHVSTDFVFDGTSSTPYRPEDEPSPVSVYGRTKHEGEVAVRELRPGSGTVVRTAWLYGEHGGNFVKTMLRLMRERDEISVVADQTGTPTWASSLAGALWGLAAQSGLSGIFHWTDGGQATWHEFANAVQEEALSLGILKKAIPVHAITTDEYPTPAQRPKYSVLDCTSTQEVLGYEPADWRVNLRRMLKAMRS